MPLRTLPRAHRKGFAHHGITSPLGSWLGVSPRAGKKAELALHCVLLKIERVGEVNQGTGMSSALILYELESCI